MTKYRQNLVQHIFIDSNRRRKNVHTHGAILDTIVVNMEISRKKKSNERKKNVE